jgi:hypothetical protein
LCYIYSFAPLAVLAWRNIRRAARTFSGPVLLVLRVILSPVFGTDKLAKSEFENSLARASKAANCESAWSRPHEEWRFSRSE